MTTMPAIVELRRRSAVGIYAVPYRSQRPGKALRLPDGAIVAAPSLEERCEAPDRLPDCFEVAAGGGHATIHHANLGLVAAYLSLEGVYLLSDGVVAAVYGAETIEVD